MKKILFASTALVASAGFAAAEVTFSGEAGMGMIYDGTTWSSDFDATLSVSMTGETDGGLSFGADFDITSGATSIDEAIVYIEGGFGKLSIGEVTNAIDAITGGIADVGYSGLGVDDKAESGRGVSAASALYTGTFGDFSVALSHDIGGSDFGVAAGYDMGDYSFALGFEEAAGVNTVTVSAGAAMGDIAFNALYATNLDTKVDSYGVDASYTMGAVSVTAAYGNDGTDEAFGLGVSYDLGGGASIDAGVAEVAGVTVADLGINMEF